MSTRHPRMASLRSPAALRERIAALGLDLPCDDALRSGPDSPLAAPLELGGGLTVTNRFVVQPMEGWDGTPDGRPTALTLRRWQHFGASGAGWIWGGEAVAVRRDGRANPGQLVIDEASAPALGALRRGLIEAAHGAGHPAPLVGLQLTHSGRWSVPEPGARRPRIAFRHPLLDRRVGVDDDAPLLRDDELPDLVRAFAEAARRAADQGFDFVDVKHCHGYLLHEFLAARTRAGDHGGRALEARTRLMREILDAVAAAAPGLRRGVRLSVFDGVPHRTARGPEGAVGVPEPHALPYPHAFGVDPAAPERRDPTEPVAVVRELVARGAGWINVTAASPYYVPHLQRPALFSPSDGYPTPEDPLVGVARLLDAAREIKKAVPEAVVVSSGWSYLQEWLPHVAQACVREGRFDAVGLGRMMLSYPGLPADVLAGVPLDRRRICRTFSDCTSAPRAGLVSGCYPLDPFYRQRPEREVLEAARRREGPGR